MIATMLPERLQLGPLAIPTYSLFVNAAIVLGLAALARVGHRREQRAAAWVDAGIAALLLGMIEARVEHVAVHWSYFVERPEQIARLWAGGLGWHGAVFGGLVGLWLGSWYRRVSWPALLGVLSVVLPLAAMLTYGGCIAGRCVPGAEVETLAGYPAFIAAELPDTYGIVAPRLFTPLYGIALSAVVAAAALALRVRGVDPAIRFWLVLAMLALVSFGLGFTRGDAAPMVGPLRLDQALDLATAAAAALAAALVAQARRASAAPSSLVEGA